MLWQRGRRSSNVEDRRGRRMGGKAAGGIGGIGLVIAVGYFFLSGDPSMLIRQIAGGGGFSGQQQQSAPAELTEQEKQLTDFVSVVLADTEDVWKGIFQANGLSYKEPVLVLYTDQTPQPVVPDKQPPDRSTALETKSSISTSISWAK